MNKHRCPKAPITLGVPKTPLYKVPYGAPFHLCRLKKKGGSMRRVAVFADAGYFWVQATQVLLGARGMRSDVDIQFDILRQELLAVTKAQFPDADLLRVYWYDGPGAMGSKTWDHRAIEDLDDFKLKLGTRNGKGSQKAVDGLIIADMIMLAQAKAITDALLLSGDADLAPGMVASQALGIRVHLLSMGSQEATSPGLKAEADAKVHWDDIAVKKFARIAMRSSAGAAQPASVVSAVASIKPSLIVSDAPTAPPAVQSPRIVSVAASASKTPLDYAGFAATAITRCNAMQIARVVNETDIPQELDRMLLGSARAAAGGHQFSGAERLKLRAAFRQAAAAEHRKNTAATSA